MPRKKAQEEKQEEKYDKKQKRGKKGGRSKKDTIQQNDNTLDYIEVDEFTLDDLPGSDR